ncbi:TniB family NTP-binding protein [Ornithinibacillus caprae]|uniref:TniB family NTP-binding protein n=1 Tax=Ornithinibacillus caprae TaxID=2678566 RepID=UPI0012D8C774|nr:TniB family NTP-binding protein [Ornithinibacillus caprae]
MKNEYTEFQKRVINLYIEHPEVKKLWEIFDRKRLYRRLGAEQDSEEGQLHLFVKGNSRVGKSQMMKKYKKLNKGYEHIKEDGTEIDIVPVAYMNCPAPFTKKGLYNQIIKSLGATKMSGDVETIKDRAYFLLKEQKCEMLIIDELDYLLSSTYVSRKESMELIKGITNETDVCLILVGTHETDKLRKLDQQYKGRFPPRTIPVFQTCDQSFIDLLISIEEQLAIPDYSLELGNADSAFPELLHQLSGGLLGWLTPILREAFAIVGVFEPDFKDFSILNNIDGNVLIQARENVLGEITEEDFDDVTTNKI